jgi:hypothetical protein
MLLERKILIALEGPSQSGKTKSIKNLADMIQKKYQSRVYKSKKWKECMEVHLLAGHKVGLSSRSDKFPIFRENFEFLSGQLQCAFIVCALNEKTKGMEDYMNALKLHDWEIFLIRKSPDFYDRVKKENQFFLNQTAAVKLLDCLMNQLKINNNE